MLCLKKTKASKNKDICEVTDLKRVVKSLDDIPTIASGNFETWFNMLTENELDEIWKNRKFRKKIEGQLRNPGGLHEWLCVARAPKFKKWKVNAEKIRELRTLIEDVKFINPIGKHGGDGSTKAHNEILKLIDEANTYEEYVKKLNEWAKKKE